MSWARILAFAWVLAFGAWGVVAWTAQPSPQPIQRMETVALERTGCFGPCPIYRVMVQRNGHVTFEGDRYEFPHLIKRTVGRWHTQMPADALQALVEAVESHDYAQLKPEYSQMRTDAPSTILTVSGGGLTRRTHVYAVPCRKAANRTGGDQQVVPDVFCSVASLVDVASCARYWGAATRPPFGGPAISIPSPPRCKPRP